MKGNREVWDEHGTRKTRSAGAHRLVIGLLTPILRHRERGVLPSYHMLSLLMNWQDGELSTEGLGHVGAS